MGFGGVFAVTTAVLAAGVVSVLVFGLSTAGQSLETLSEDQLVEAPQLQLQPQTVPRR
jgi:putative MFS transporter